VLSTAAAFTMLLCAALSGCGSDAEEAAAAAATPPTKHPSANRSPAASAAEMVAAVGAKPGAGVVDLRFVISKRPQVNQPVDIELALTPSVELEHLFARFQVAEGLQLVAGAETPHIEHPAANVAIGHKLTVIPQGDGIFYITAVVLADSDKDSVARNFNIPLIAGQGLAEAPATPTAASVADPKQAPARP